MPHGSLTVYTKKGKYQFLKPGIKMTLTTVGHSDIGRYTFNPTVSPLDSSGGDRGSDCAFSAKVYM